MKTICMTKMMPYAL